MKTKFIFLVILLNGSIVYADKKGDQIISHMDAGYAQAKDQQLTMEMIIQQKDSDPRKLGYQVHQRGTKRRIDYLYPGDVKGMKILTLSRDQMYIYLPAFKKIRRIASHVKNQTIFGADYNYDDMSTTQYGDVFDGKYISETKTHWKIQATVKKGATTPYPRIDMMIRKDISMPEVLYFYNEKGQKIRTETRLKYECKSKMCNAKEMKMVDHLRNNHWTKMELLSWNINTDFSESVFSLRNLQAK